MLYIKSAAKAIIKALKCTIEYANEVNRVEKAFIKINKETTERFNRLIDKYGEETVLTCLWLGIKLEG